MYFFRTTSRRSVKKIRNHVNSVKKLQALRSPNLPKLTTRSRNYPEGVPTSSHETFKSPAFYARALARGELNVAIWIDESSEPFCCFSVTLALFGRTKITTKNACKETPDKQKKGRGAGERSSQQEEREARSAFLTKHAPITCVARINLCLFLVSLIWCFFDL